MTELSGTVAAGLLKALADFAVSQGARSDALLKDARIDPAALRSLHHRLPLQTLFDLLAGAAAATGDAAVALRFGDEWEMAEASIAGLIGWSAESVAEAFRMQNSYGRLIIDIECSARERFQLATEVERLVITDTRLRPDAFPQLTEFTFARIAAVSRRMFPGRYYIREVHFAHPAPSYRDLFEGVFQASVFFDSPPNRLVADAAVLAEKATLSQPRYAAPILGAHADALLQELSEGSGATRKVEALIVEALPARHTGKRWIAQKLGMSVQTLHRRLKAEGTTYEQVLRDVQLRQAKECLRANLSVKQTAHRVGFSAAASFSRAFKRWTGESPTSARS